MKHKANNTLLFFECMSLQQTVINLKAREKSMQRGLVCGSVSMFPDTNVGHDCTMWLCTILLGPINVKHRLISCSQ
jgi:hypothetical protein